MSDTQPADHCRQAAKKTFDKDFAGADPSAKNGQYYERFEHAAQQAQQVVDKTLGCENVDVLPACSTNTKNVTRCDIDVGVRGR